MYAMMAPLAPPFGEIPGTGLLRFLLDLFQVCLLARLVLNWMYPRSTHAVSTFLEKVTEPLLEPLRQYVPRTESIDFAAVFLFVVLDALKWLLGPGGFTAFA